MLITNSCNVLVLCNGRPTNLRLYVDGAFTFTLLPKCGRIDFIVKLCIFTVNHSKCLILACITY